MSSETKKGKIEGASVTGADIDPAFLSEVLDLPDGRLITKCMQCGTCTGVCEIQDLYPDYNIRKTLTKAVLGLGKEILPSNDIWLCAHCYCCVERCPRGVRPGERMAQLQGLALRKKLVDNKGGRHAKAYLDSILSYGKINEFKVTMKSMGIGGLIGQGPGFMLKLILKRKNPKIMKKKMHGMDALAPIIREILEGKA